MNRSDNQIPNSSEFGKAEKTYGSVGEFLDKDAFDILAVMGVLWRGKFIILFVGLITVLVGAYYAYKVSQPKFTAVATVEFTPQDNSFLNIEDIISGSGIDEAKINTEIATIRSREMLSALTEELGLMEDPNYNVALQSSPILDVKAILGISQDLEDMSDAQKLEMDHRIATVEVAKSIVVKHRLDTHLFDITVQAMEPELAANMANELARIYIDFRLEQSFEQANAATKWLSERVSDFENMMREREDAINSLKTQSGLIDQASLELLGAQEKDLRDRVERQQLEIAEILDTLNNLVEAREIENIPYLLEILQSQRSSPAGLPLDLGGEASQPDVLKLADIHIQKTTATYRQAKIELGILSEASSKAMAQLTEKRENFQLMMQLEREFKVSSELYQSLLTGLQEATIRIGLIQPNSQILSKAVAPFTPSSPKRLRIMVFSFLLGCALGSGYLLIREALSDDLKDIEEIESILGLPVLGEVAKASIRRREKMPDYLRKKPTSAVAEAVRNLRTSILMTLPEGPPQVIMLTSTEPGEGKTSLSIMLAMNMAQLDKKVLLIDGDLRRRTLHQYITDSDISTGLQEVLAGTGSLETAVVSDPGTGIDILLSKGSELSAADTLSSVAFSDLLATARRQYDFIVIDTPPVLLVPDARIIAPFVDFVAYVVGWGSTSKRRVKAGVRQFAIGAQPIHGVIVNQIDNRKIRHYGYGSYGNYNGYQNTYYE